MKPIEIAERLKREFPGRFVSFEIECHWHGNASGACEVVMSIYDNDHGTIYCRSLDEGIAALHRKINPQAHPPEIDIDVSEGGKA